MLMQFGSLISDESDENESSSENDHVHDPLLNNTKPTRKQRSKIERKDMLIQTKDEDHSRNSSTQTNLIEETTPVKNELRTSAIKLNDITLNEFLEILNVRISNDVTHTIKETFPQRYGDYGILSNLSARSNIPVNKLVNLRPRAHTRLHESASDSGLSSGSEYTNSLSAWYADAPSNYV